MKMVEVHRVKPRPSGHSIPISKSDILRIFSEANRLEQQRDYVRGIIGPLPGEGEKSNEETNTDHRHSPGW